MKDNVTLIPVRKKAGSRVKSMGMSLEVISSATGLSEQEILLIP